MSSPMATYSKADKHKKFQTFLTQTTMTYREKLISAYTQAVVENASLEDLQEMLYNYIEDDFEKLDNEQLQYEFLSDYPEEYREAFA